MACHTPPLQKKSKETRGNGKGNMTVWVCDVWVCEVWVCEVSVCEVWMCEVWVCITDY